jgi:hypothetical protein
MDEFQTSIKLNRKAKTAIILGLSPFILFLGFNLILSIINHEFGEMDCWKEKKYLNLEFSGLIIEKDRDAKNHMDEYITILNLSNEKQRIYLYSKPKQLWTKLEINDSITKKKNSMDFQITRQKKIIIISPSFNCNEDDFWLDPYNE